MADLEHVVAARVHGEPLSLHEVLYTARIQGRLGDLVREAVEDRIIAEQARKLNVTAGDEELQAAVDAFRQAHRLQKAEATLAWLSEHHLTVLDLQTRLERDLLRKKLRDRIPRDEVERYFLENRSFFERCVLSQLVTDRQGVAEELLSQVRDDGVDFGVLARKHSQHKDTRQAGGFLGVVNRKALTPAIEAAVFGAAAGAVLGPFKTASGYALVKVEELLPAVLDDATAARVRATLFDFWLKDQMRRAEVTMPLFDLFGK